MSTSASDQMKETNFQRFGNHTPRESANQTTPMCGALLCTQHQACPSSPSGDVQVSGTLGKDVCFSPRCYALCFSAASEKDPPRVCKVEALPTTAPRPAGCGDCAGKTAEAIAFPAAGAVRPPAYRRSCGATTTSGPLFPSCRWRQHVLFSLAAFGWQLPLWLRPPLSGTPFPAC